MIKIPGTDEGVPAIEEAIYEGINVNVTLLFGVESYARGRRGLHPRPRAPPRGGRVARRALGRVLLRLARRHRGRQAPARRRPRATCAGTAAVANARAAYQRFKEIFRGRALRRAARRRRAGAAPAVGVDRREEPALPRDHVRRRRWSAPRHRQHDADGDAAGRRRAARGQRRRRPTRTRRADLSALADAGIDMDDVTAKLLREGIEKFVEPIDKLIAGIERRARRSSPARPPTIEASIPDELEPARRRAGQAGAADEDVAQRIWRKDETLWGGRRRARDRQPPRLADDRRADARAAPATCTRSPTRCGATGFTDAVLLGMGGSSLGPEVIRRSFGEIAGRAAAARARLDRPGRGARRSSARSTSTRRCSSSRRSRAGRSRRSRTSSYFCERRRRRHAASSPITDPGSRAGEARATSTASGASFENDPDIGGRYSVLSYFGLVPAALMGVDVGGAAAPARRSPSRTATASSPARRNSGLWLGARDGRAGAAGPRQADLRRRPSRSRASASGSSS